MRVAQALQAAIRALARAGVPGHRHDAEWLLAHLLSTDRGGLLVRRDEPLEPAIAACYEEWIARRSRREPLQHLTGEQPFLDLDLKVDARALIPRPETELLVEAALEMELPRGARVADLGTGSGCIAVTLAHRRPDLVIHALDCSAQALELARENAGIAGVVGSISFVQGDFRDPPREWEGRFDLVVSNPPYVSEAEWSGLEPEVRDHDPREALVAGPTGYEAYRLLVPRAQALLRAGGRLLLELGCGQAATVEQLARAAGFRELSVRSDLQRIPRVLVAVDCAGATRSGDR